MSDGIILTTMCVVWDKVNKKILMINRNSSNWRGYAPPGGHLEFPESLTDCAVREVKEETGLVIWDLNFKGIVHFVDAVKKNRYMVFNYIAENFSGELCKETHEGKPEWININDLDKIQLAHGMEQRLGIFFSQSISEMHVIWDESGWRQVNRINLLPNRVTLPTEV